MAGVVEFFFAPCTLAYAIALPAMNRITPIRTNIIVCFFTEPSPSRPTDDVRQPVTHRLVAGSVGMYDGNYREVHRTF